MNNLNKIFGLVQRYCLEHVSIDTPEKFRGLANEAGVSPERLHFYLDCLHDKGLLLYSQEGRTVSLTEKGANAMYIFPIKQK